MFTFLFFYFFLCATVLTVQRLQPFVPHEANLLLGNTDQMHEKCIFDVAGRERWMMGKKAV